MRSNTPEYVSLHGWIRRHLGTSDSCEHCEKSELKGRQIHWANRSGKYKRDLDDWIRLCVACHYKYDGRAAKRRKCQVCDKVFKITPSRVKSAKYCSYKCRAVVMRGSNHPSWKRVKDFTKVACGTCSKEFMVASYRLRYGLGKWCSRKCYYRRNNVSL